MTQPPLPTRPAHPLRAPFFLVLVGICAALHIWKLPPALPALQIELGLDLVESGFLLSIVQLGGMTLGLVAGLFAERIGLRRCVITGLLILALASATGALFQSKTLILLFRGLEGCGFLLAVMPVPALIKRLVPSEYLSRLMSLWSCYMPLGTVLILLSGSWLLSIASWQALWLALGALTLLVMLLTLRIVPPDPVARAQTPKRQSSWSLVRTTLASPNVWLIALVFGVYAGQWIAVIGFLPSIYVTAGISGSTAGLLTALVAGSNIIGNLTAGKLLHQGISARRLLMTGFLTMIVCTFAAFGAGLSTTGQFFAVLMFSMVGGLIPATLFVLAIRYAPTPQTTSTTVGWMQQCSSLGQFSGPPVVAWVVHATGGWQWTWLATGSFALAGILMTLCIGIWGRRT
ncbi:MFS transporter [Castellaniella sp.]|uniref:MFS transporter n=1 Tax=Castellaniella sp. TaxID=1955812 RepID=UPI002AFF7DEF|nr:MFS transporter [Castellaniella sp.]